MVELVTGPLTRAAWVDQQLREAILNGDFEPGERLMTAPLAERFSVSPTPLREALQRLAAEGLVDITPQRGARVSPLSVQDGLALLEVRHLLEPTAVGQSLRNGDGLAAHVREEAVKLHQSRADGAPELELARASRRVSDAIKSSASNVQLLRALAHAEDQLMRYHVLALRDLGPDKLLLDGEGAVGELVADGDIEGVLSLLDSHRQAMDAAVRQLGGQGTITSLHEAGVEEGVHR